MANLVVPPKKQKWEPSVLKKHPDNLVSSQYAASPQFVPSYEKEDVNMYFLLAMEYSRIWFKERDLTKRVVLSETEPAFLQRKYVVRGLLKRKQVLNPPKPFRLKRFDNVQAKTKNVFTPKSKIENTASQTNEEQTDKGEK